MHPTGTRVEPSGRLQGSGVDQHDRQPLETTIALSPDLRHARPLPGAQICAAHGGGFASMRHVRINHHDLPDRVGPLPKKKPTQYLKDSQLYFTRSCSPPRGCGI
jgi:aminocarboxymuconate-semialdehyde decarboxylase